MYLCISLSSRDDAINQRLKTITFSKTRVAGIPDESLFQLRRDPEFISKQKSPRFQMCLRQVLFDAYAEFISGGSIDIDPADSDESKDEWVQENLFTVGAFLSEYELTDDFEDYVKTEDITGWLKDYKMNISIQRMVFGLKPHVHKMKIFKGEQKVIDRRRIGIRRGMKYKNEESKCLIKRTDIEYELEEE